MHSVIVRQESENSMQSIRRTGWCVEFFKTRLYYTDPVMNWNASLDTDHQVKMSFLTYEACIKFAKQNNFIIVRDYKNCIASSKRKSYIDTIKKADWFD